MSTRWTLWEWPFFEQSHRDLAVAVADWNERGRGGAEKQGASGEALIEQCRTIARELGEADLLRYVIPPAGVPVDVRAICVIREALTYEHALADAIFAMQGIGTMAIQRFGTDAQKENYLEPCRRGRHIAALALTEPEGGSDVASTATTAVLHGDSYVLNGEKTLISNAGFADHYIVVARTGEAPGSRGLSAFLVDSNTPGLTVGDPIDFIAPHPAAAVTFADCKVKVGSLLGAPGQGFKVALGAFDIFRPSVGAAAVGLARRALAETLTHVKGRKLFGKPMAELQAVQMTLAEMATDVDLAALSVYRAAWIQDVQHAKGSYSASMAKLAGAEAAGRVVDQAVQLLGGKGVTRGNIIEQLYREARPMRIYEGTSEVQKLVIARAMLAGLERQM
jgi:acyl-CoA dehydrogenase